MADAEKVLATGRTNTEEALREASEGFDEPAKVELPEERATRFSRTNFSRMSLEWGRDDQMMMARIHRTVDAKLDEHFGDMLALRHELLCLVREQRVRPDGTKAVDEDGLPVWRKTQTGMYVEDWTKLTHRERVNWIFKLQMYIVEWEGRANEIWGEAMFAKARWEEAFSHGFESLKEVRGDTIPKREARGKIESAEERYFAIFLSYYSRQAESSVKNMKDLLLRISQVHQAASGR